MEFRIVADRLSPAWTEDNSVYPPDRALYLLRQNPALLAEDTKTGVRYGLVDLEQLLGEQRDGGDA